MVVKRYSGCVLESVYAKGAVRKYVLQGRQLFLYRFYIFFML